MGRDPGAPERAGRSGPADPAEDLDRILEAGRRAPSALNKQPWDFVAVTEPGRLRSSRGLEGRAGTWPARP